MAAPNSDWLEVCETLKKDDSFQQRVGHAMASRFEEMKDEPPYSMFIWSVVQGWQGQIQGILADDILIQINDTKLEDLDFDDVMNLLLTSSRPLILKVRRDKYAEQQQQLEPKDMEKEDTTTKKKEDTQPN